MLLEPRATAVSAGPPADLRVLGTRQAPRASTTGFLAGNALLSRWGVAGEDLWTVTMRGLLARGR
ncbi:hypothetical protein CWC38_06890 [Kocuria tytonicola]|nr:hypothetical protein CWC38_06890 [Kocuria tytonicola]